MIDVLFVLSLLAASLLLLLSLLSLWLDWLQFWPPPNRHSWQYRTFWLLFRLMIFGLTALSFFDFGSLPGISFWWRYIVGLALAIAGFGSAFYATFYLGWKNAHGETEGLKTEGWYRVSRNPIYVVTIVGMAGLGLFVHSGRVWLLLAIWIIFYLLAPLLEEPWLEARYGAEYLAYKQRVPRFI